MLFPTAAVALAMARYQPAATVAIFSSVFLFCLVLVRSRLSGGKAIAVSAVWVDGMAS